MSELAEPFLKVNNLSVRFSGIVALNNINLEMHEAQILGLIGPNGSGKTTLFNCFSCLVKPQHGEIIYKDQNILKLAPHQIVSLGISRTFQHLTPYTSMTVLENVMVGGHSLAKSSILSNALFLPGSRTDDRVLRERAMQILDDFGLADIAHRPISSQQFTTIKRIDIARALMCKPKLLLMDEPAGGLSHGDIETFKEIVLHLRDTYKLSILLIEHHMKLLMEVSDYIVALDSGQIIAQGTAQHIQQHPEVIRVYLGATE
jgi:branched-chain amino acid transport system ATP-binding protein